MADLLGSLNPLDSNLSSMIGTQYSMSIPIQTADMMVTSAQIAKQKAHSLVPFDGLLTAGLLMAADAQVTADFSNKLVYAKSIRLPRLEPRPRRDPTTWPFAPDTSKSPAC